MPPRPDVPAAPGGLPGWMVKLARYTLVKRFLGLTLFWKIAVANTALIAGTAAVVMASTSPVGVEELTLFGVAALVVGVVANALLVRAALSPLGALERAARRVSNGDVNARAASSPMADTELRRMTEVFNGMLDALDENRLRQRELARRVLESEERERERIAHELFSGTAQTLAAVLLRLRIAERSLSNGGSKALAEIRDGVVDALEEVRGVARRLRPPELDELGVRVALEAHARAMTEGRSVELRITGDIPELSREAALALFRIVQEAINNAVLHAAADLVTVSFARDGDSVVAEIVDDGCGFEPDLALEHAGESLGLFGMHERAGYVRGQLTLESGPGRGTRIRARIPLDGPGGLPHYDEIADRLVHGLTEAHG